MPEILAGAGILFGILILMRLFVSANPSTLAVGVRYAGVGALGLTAATLFYLRRIDLGLLAAGMAYGLFTNGHILPRGFPFGMFFPYGGASSRRRRRGPSAGQSSKVATAWLELELEHDSGDMQGAVLQGKFAGKALASLSPDELLALYGEAGRADAETARLLEAYLDRRLGPEWRLRQQQEPPGSEQSKPRGRRDSGMSRTEAYSVLGLMSGASDEEVRAAHKRLMMQNHPDRGGSDYLASKINEAKDVLLGE